MESKLFTARDAETQTHELNTELVIFQARVDARRLWKPDVRARVVASTNGPGTEVEYIFGWIGNIMEKLRMDLASLVRTGSRNPCADFTILLVAYSTIAFIESPLLLTHGPFPPVRLPLPTVTPLCIVTICLPNWFFSAQVGDIIDIEKVMAVLISNVSPSHTLTPHAVNISCST